MTAFPRILVGLDLGATRKCLTAGSALVAERVRELARREGAAVTLLHSQAADEHWDAGEDDYVYAPSGLPGDGRAALERALAALREAGVEADLVVTEERPVPAIVEHVRERGIDLVLTGKRSEPVRGGRRIGSVSMSLLRQCPCAVWVARPGTRSPLRTVLAATDLSDAGEWALRAGAHVAARFDATLRVVHALQLSMSVQMSGASAQQEWERERRAEVEAALRATLAEEEAVADVHLHVGLGAPTSAITHAVERFDVDLVAMGTVSRGGLPGLVVGNTAERLLDRLDCSLLVVKPAGALRSA